MGINIITLNRNNEPFDIQHVNIKEEVFFSYENDSSTSFLDINGSEKWVWNFDVDGITSGTSGVIYDQVIQEIDRFNDPIPTIFYRSGDRVVSVDVYDGTNLKYSDSISFFVFDFPKEIIGTDHVEYNTGATFTINTINDSLPTFKWYINGQLNASSSGNLTISPFTSKSTIECHVINGIQTHKYKKTVIISVGNAVLGKKYESNVTSNLMFFNKEGDNLNFEYVETEDGIKRWEGDLIFHQNSSDTFKTIGLYLLEKVEPLKFAAPNNELILEKFQLFTENGIDFEPKYSEDILIENIQPVNNNSDFFTKWLFSNDIHLKLPIGAEIYLEDIYSVDFDNENDKPEILISYSPISDFNSHTVNGLKTFTVIGSKKDAVMIITDTDNKTYSELYGETTSVEYNYGQFRKSNNAIQNVPQGRIKCLNLIKLFDSGDLNPEWNEPSYKGLLYDKKKLTIINSQKNDGVYTFNYVNDDSTNEIINKIIKINSVDMTDFIPDPKYGFKIDISFKTNKLLLSSGIPIDFLPKSTDPFLSGRDILVWESLLNKDYTPLLLKEGLSFFFEQTAPTQPNLSMLYDCVKIDNAENILTYQTDDTQGYRLVLKDYNALKNYTFDILVNGKSNYIFTESKHWNRGLTLNEATYNLAQAITNKVVGLSLLVQNNEIWVWEKQNYKFELTNIVNNTIFTLQKGILTQNNPQYGIIGDQWVELSDDIYNGYIHYRREQGNYHVVYFSGVYPNFTPSWYVLPAKKKVVWVEATSNIEFVQNIIADSYLDETKLTFEQIGDVDTLVTSEVLVQRFISRYKNTLKTYGIDLYQTMTDLCLARTNTITSLNSTDDYLDIDFFIDNTLAVEDFLSNTSGTSGTNVPDQFVIYPNTITYKDVDILNVIEDVVLEYNHNYGSNIKPKALSSIFQRKIIIKDIDQKFGFVLTINGIDYPVTFDNIATSLNSTEDNIVDIEETLMDWGNQRFKYSQNLKLSDDVEVGKKYWEVLESLGILVWLEKSEESYVTGSQKYDTIVIESKFPNITFNYSVNGTLNNHKILHSDIQFVDIGTSLTITINRVAYQIQYQGTISSTLSAWKEEYYETLLAQEIIVDHFEDSTSGTSFIDLNNNILRFSTLRERTNLNYTIYVGKTPTLGKDVYYITNWRSGNQGVLISGNEINVVSGADFQESGFGTGMIMSLQGSKYPLNNQEYNLILVEPNTLGLSYQGAFWDESNISSSIIDRSSFDWSSFDEQTTTTIGLNHIPNGKFNGSSWWVYNTDEFFIMNNSLEVESNVGFQTQLMQLGSGNYKLSYTSIDAGTNGHYGSQGMTYSPVTVSIFAVNGNSQTLIYQDIQQNYGAFSEDIILTGEPIIILFSNGLSNMYFNIDNIAFEELDYVSYSNLITLSTREFLRYPRERFDGEEPVQFKFSWEEENDNSIFLYDFSGEQLKLRNDGIYQYNGNYPLIDENGSGYLNEFPNRDLSKVNDMKFQQTVWDELFFNLKLVDSETDINPLTTPIQTFIGYKSLDEGVNSKTLLIHRLENVSTVVDTRIKKNNLNQDEWVDIINFDEVKQELSLQNSTLNFIQIGFKQGQRILLTGNDITNKNNQAIFKNSGFEGIIEIVNSQLLVLKPLNRKLKSESTKTFTRNTLPPFKQKDAAIRVKIEVIPEEIGRIAIKGQTEIEDERFKVQLNNFGFNINHRDTFIFKEYDIKENGIDWTFLNAKRKEMLFMYPEIYNYLGSYKSLVNAINYFGYNDLELYEYYKNIDKNSDKLGKLHKVEIPDMFDNSVSGFTPKDYILQSLPDNRYEKTRLFNLTYRITDFDGNNVLAYSLDEVITKLLGLKKWLREEIMPIGTRIRDITGRGSTLHTTELWHDVKFNRKLKVKESISPIDFKIESYLQPVSNNSRTYNVHLDFFTNDETLKPDYYHLKITTFASKPNENDSNFKLKAVQLINEYKTDLKSYNFSADRNLDPYILVEVMCDNGYGATYKVKKSFQVK